MSISHEDYLDIKRSMGQKSAKEAVKASYDNPKPERKKSINARIELNRAASGGGGEGRVPHKYGAKHKALAKKSGSFEKMNAERKRQGYRPKTDRATKGLYDFLDK